MRAIHQPEFGGPERLTPVRVPRPVPLPTEVLVRVIAAGVNPCDHKTGRGEAVAPAIGALPFIPGWDVSGVVEEVGFGVTTLAPGDEVYGMPWFPRAAGAYAEYVTAPSRHFARKPRTADHVHAAALPLAALTAWQALVDTAEVEEGMRVLVHAGAGGVGHLAVQLAKHLGCHVTATARAGNHAWLRDLGADECVDYTEGPFEERIGGIDVVLDLVGDDHAETGSRSMAVLEPGGLYVAVASSAPHHLLAGFRERGFGATSFLVEPDGVALGHIATLVDSGVLRVEVADVLPLADVADAYRASAGGRVRGKLVLRVSP
ncbi:NADP-dependent oxidoreductase [Saccharothrix syringae]|uniref:NADP-dependent oxidoreductase n=1 Tax=Saccharothrix syringae TaxID=103733 RepID=A0A5Q0HEH3_SACSY|nr:NADP-dependent oxidoreductase [Saccharothrix syringae]QFZ24250.1 NADP-dependent oxidoreductase [Saccharothrix syringae]